MKLAPTLLASAAFAAASAVHAADVPPAPAAQPAKPVEAYTFSQLRGMAAAAVKPRLVAWLQAAGKHDPAAVEAIWTPAAKPADAALATIALGLPESATVLAEARLPGTLPAGELPPLLRDDKLDPFVRANLAAAYAKALAGRRAYEEAVAAARLAPAELVIDPASYFFHKAVAEHSLMQRDAATATIARLLDDVSDAPDRYRVVAAMMFFDLQQWSPDEKDLTNITRLMDNSGRRLELARGGPDTQAIQKKIVFRLDEKIKELEAKAKQQQQQASGKPGDPNCPAGGQPVPGNGGAPSGPMEDSFGGTNSGPGQVDVKKLRSYEQVWGTLPEAERKKVTQDFIRDMPPKFKPMIEDYFRSLNRMNGFK